VYHDFVFPLPLSAAVPVGAAIAGSILPRRSRIAHRRLGLFKRLLTRIQQTRNSHTERAALTPSSIGEGRIVGGGCGEVPVLVGGIEARAMPVAPSAACSTFCSTRADERVPGNDDDGGLLLVRHGELRCIDYVLQRKLHAHASQTRPRAWLDEDVAAAAASVLVVLTQRWSRRCVMSCCTQREYAP